MVKQDATDGGKINLYHTDDALHIQVNSPSFGMIAHEQDIPGATHIRPHWGVSTYPQGASYEHGIDNEAIMVYVFFGHEKYSIEVDTTSSKNDGKAASFLQRIEFLN